MKRRGLTLTGGVVLGVLAQLSSVGLLLAAAWLIVRAAQHPPVLYLMVAIVSVRFFGISRSVFRYGERLLTHDVAFADAVTQRVKTYQDLNRVAPTGLTGWRRGELISRVVDDVSSTQDRLLRVRMNWWTGIAATAAVALVLGVLVPSAGFILAVSALMLGVLIRIVVPTLIRQSGSSAGDSRGELAAEVSATALSAVELVALDATSNARTQAHEAAARISSSERKESWFAGLGSALVLITIGAAIVAIAGITRWTDPVLIGVLLLAPMALAEAWDGWVEAERFRPQVEAAEQRLDALAEASVPVNDPAAPVALPDGWRFDVHDVVCGWDTPLIEPCSFTVKPGQTLGISAPSGTGKSTLAWTLLRLIEPHAGRIGLGGVGVTTLTASDVRQRIGYVGQDEVVFDTSIKENLRIGDPEATETALWQALERVRLADFVRGLPEGLETLVGEAGGRLSGGERQRLCVARLLLSGHRIWILDEPTEHLDAPTAKALMADVLALTHEGTEPIRSIIVISHIDSVLAETEQHVSLSARL